MYITIKSIGKTIYDFHDKRDYCNYLLSLLIESDHPVFYLIPEYAWGNNNTSDISEQIKKIGKSLSRNQVFVLGTTIREVDGKKHNSAIIINSGRVNFIDKTNVLEQENTLQEVKSGKNSKLINIGGLKIAVVICADIWNNELLNYLLKEKQADMLLVPAYTTVPTGLGNYAQTQWYSLALVRSREYLVPIAVADHHSTLNDKFSVGAASLIVDPSWKNKNMNHIQDFLVLPNKLGIVECKIDLEKVKVYKKYRLKKGLYSV